jgi:hypothetical protein
MRASVARSEDDRAPETRLTPIDDLKPRFKSKHRGDGVVPVDRVSARSSGDSKQTLTQSAAANGKCRAAVLTKAQLKLLRNLGAFAVIHGAR